MRRGKERVFKDLDLRGLFHPNGVGINIIRPWLGCTPAANRRAFVGMEPVAIQDYSVSLREIASSRRGEFTEGRRYITSALNRRRLFEARKAEDALEEGYGMTVGMNAYGAFGARQAISAAESGKAHSKAQKAGKSELSMFSINQAGYRVTFGEEVLPLYPMSAKCIPVSDVVWDVMRHVGLGAKPALHAQSLIMYLRKLDRGFPGDMTEQTLIRDLSKLPPDGQILYLVAAGMDSRKATFIDHESLADYVVDDAIAQGLVPVLGSFCDLTRINLERLVTIVGEQVSPMQTRSILLLGMVIFCSQKRFRRVILHPE
jgi:hypothetical protein